MRKAWQSFPDGIRARKLNAGLIALTLFALALDLGGQAGFFRSPASLLSPLRKAEAARAAGVSGGPVLVGSNWTSAQPAPVSDEAISAFVRQLMAEHNRSTSCKGKRHRRPRVVKSAQAILRSVLGPVAAAEGISSSTAASASSGRATPSLCDSDRAAPAASLALPGRPQKLDPR
jgi:hypothetical protein